MPMSFFTTAQIHTGFTIPTLSFIMISCSTLFVKGSERERLLFLHALRLLVDKGMLALVYIFGSFN